MCEGNLDPAFEWSPFTSLAKEGVPPFREGRAYMLVGEKLRDIDFGFTR